MYFDPAIAAQHALHRAEEERELGEHHREIVDAEEVFSTDEGVEAQQAYERLIELGDCLPQASWFQEFLIYITWQQATVQTIPRHFRTGADLCDRFLARFRKELAGSARYRQVTAIQESFQGGLGIEKEIIPEHDEDAFHGGD